jgi:hypothetical protein
MPARHAGTLTTNRRKQRARRRRFLKRYGQQVANGGR